MLCVRSEHAPKFPPRGAARARADATIIFSGLTVSQSVRVSFRGMTMLWTSFHPLTLSADCEKCSVCVRNTRRHFTSKDKGVFPVDYLIMYIVDYFNGSPMGGEGEYAMCCESFNSPKQTTIYLLKSSVCGVPNPGPIGDGRTVNRRVRPGASNLCDISSGDTAATASVGEYNPACNASILETAAASNVL